MEGQTVETEEQTPTSGFDLHEHDTVPKSRYVAYGRPTKYNPEIVGKVLYALQRGATHRVACAYAGIAYETFNRWVQLSKEHGEKSMYFPFHLMVEQNIAKGTMRSLEMVEAATPTDWRAAAWRLTHGPYTRNDYSDKVELTGAGGEPLIPLEALRGMLGDASATDDDFGDENITPIREGTRRDGS